jgi:hypothetical protein
MSIAAAEVPGDDGDRDHPLTVAGPCGILTHFPLSAGEASSWPASIANRGEPSGIRSAATPGEREWMDGDIYSRGAL